MTSGFNTRNMRSQPRILGIFRWGLRQHKMGTVPLYHLFYLLFLKHEGWDPSWEPGLTSCSSNFSHQKPLMTIPLWDAFIPFIAGSLVLFTKLFFTLKRPDSHAAPCLTLCNSKMSPIPTFLSASHCQSNCKEPSMPSYNLGIKTDRLLSSQVLCQWWRKPI